MSRTRNEALEIVGCIPRAGGMSSLGETLKRRMRQPSTDSQSQLADIRQMKQYIGQVESVLGEMKEWVSKKERSISSKASHSTRGGQRSCSRKSRQQTSTRLQRPKIFFGNCKPVSKLCDSRVEVNSQACDNSKMEAKTSLGVYLKHCFISKIKERMLPPQRRRNAINRTLEGGTFDRFKGLLPKGVIREEKIDFLTPMKNGELGRSAVDLCLKDFRAEADDSLVYTVSRRRSSLRRLHVGTWEGAINNFD